MHTYLGWEVVFLKRNVHFCLKMRLTYSSGVAGHLSTNQMQYSPNVESIVGSCT